MGILEYFTPAPRRSPNLWIRALVIAAAIVLLLFWAGAIRIGGRLSPQALGTYEEIDQLIYAVGVYAKCHQGKFPGPSLPAAIAQIQAEQWFAQELQSTPDQKRTWALVVKGLDAWGRPLKYEVDHAGKWMKVRSVGRNGIEEHGRGDDIEIGWEFNRYGELWNNLSDLNAPSPAPAAR